MVYILLCRTRNIEYSTATHSCGTAARKLRLPAMCATHIVYTFINFPDFLVTV